MSKDKTLKFIQTLTREQYELLDKKAKLAGVTVQNYLRVVVIPEYLEKNYAKDYEKALSHVRTRRRSSLDRNRRVLQH